MFPMEFDHTVLDSLPLPNKDDISRVITVLHAMINTRIFQYFKKRRNTEATLIARIKEKFSIIRLEDEENRVCLISLLSDKNGHWNIYIHERIFDYFAFVIPSDPDSRIGGKSNEESKVLAFAEFLLRHQIEHILYPQKSEREIIRTDVAFAMDRRENDPTFYRMLRNSLADEMTGLKGEPYLAILDAAEQEKPYEYLITRLIDSHVQNMEDLPDHLLEEVFPIVDPNIKTRILGECYRKSSNNSYSLLRRVSCFQKVLRLFQLLIEKDEKEAAQVFHGFIDHWGCMGLFRELDYPDISLEDKDFLEIFDTLKGILSNLPQETLSICSRGPSTTPSPPLQQIIVEKPAKSLKERILEAENDPLFSRQALEVIKKNTTSAIGHSGPKYTELIETLLSIPWGKIKKITVDIKEFEQGLNRSHYGLERPKEIICDFFANLIWRYKTFNPDDASTWQRTGSAFLFVGPPGVGKTSLAISIAENLGIPYHKISLGGMQDEADLRGHGFTYEGSKPGAIVQGLIRMGVMNGMFIMDEADKTEQFAISTLLEILDPEQNHLFHDKYTMTSVDIDLSNCVFILTANTLETVPPPVINRCEVIHLDRYSLEEKIAIARHYLIDRVRHRYGINKDDIFFDPDKEADLLAHLIKDYTREPGVRELERIIRTLFLRILRKEILTGQAKGVSITREKIKEYLDTPIEPRQIAEENRVGEMLALGVNLELAIGSIIPIQATKVSVGGEGYGGYLSMVHATGNIQKIMDESRKVATTAILYCAKELGIDLSKAQVPIHLHFMGASTPKDGPSAGGAIALALASALSEQKIRRDVAMTGEIDTQGRILGVGALDLKLETAYNAGCKTMIIPRENMGGSRGIEELPDALKRELQIFTYEQWKGAREPFDYNRHTLQVVAVDHIVQAADIAFIKEEEIRKVKVSFTAHARKIAKVLAKSTPTKDLLYCFWYIKEPGEISLDLELSPVLDKYTNIFLCTAAVKKEIGDSFPSLAQKVSFQDFAAGQDKLLDVITQVLQSTSQKKRAHILISIVAPYYFLAKEGLKPLDLTQKLAIKDTRLLANNFTFQGVKIKPSKPILNSLYGRLAGLETAEIKQCPFLKRIGETFVVDLGFIPEKYRLDIKHAQELLRSTLTNWMKTLDRNLIKASQ
ncbi:MAG: ATP-dependent protease [Deltaproteobacteria bacterium]|nr:MAG: ATP-dependent protease [Deltaproteobacteria bacterium]